MPAYSRRLGSRSTSQMYPNQPVLHDNGEHECSYPSDSACYTLSNDMELQIHKATKMQLTGIFCIGGLYVATPLKRLSKLFDIYIWSSLLIITSNRSVYVVSIYRIPQIKSAPLIDISWPNDEPMIWSVVEIYVAIACACAITYRPLFKWIVGLHSSTTGSDPSGKRSKPSRLAADSPLFFNLTVLYFTYLAM